jgi:hypothetical protein
MAPAPLAVRRAPEAELDLTPFPAVRRWLSRVAEQPRHVPITRDFA